MSEGAREGVTNSVNKRWLMHSNTQEIRIFFLIDVETSVKDGKNVHKGISPQNRENCTTNILSIRIKKHC